MKVRLEDLPIATKRTKHTRIRGPDYFDGLRRAPCMMNHPRLLNMILGVIVENTLNMARGNEEKGSVLESER